jgi:hypothetical protein
MTVNNTNKKSKNSDQNDQTEKGTAIDHLDEDTPIPGQNFACLSFLSPEGIRNCTTRGIKIRGVYATYEEACARCEELQGIDGNFDVHVAEVGKWGPWDPDPNSSKDQVYQEKELNDLMKGYKDNLTKAKKMQEQRKGDMIKTAAHEEKSRKEKTQERLQKKLAQKDVQKKMEGIASKSMKGIMPDLKDVKLKENDELAKKEKERLNKKQKDITTSETNVNSIDDKLSKIQALYKTLAKKEDNIKNTTTTTTTTPST